MEGKGWGLGGWFRVSGFRVQGLGFIGFRVRMLVKGFWGLGDLARRAF